MKFALRPRAPATGFKPSLSGTALVRPASAMRAPKRLKIADLPPGPFDIQLNNNGFAYVVDADGKKIATLLGSNATKAAVGSLTKPEKRRARRRRNGELLKVWGETIWPKHRLHLIANRGRHVFEEEVIFVEATKQQGKCNGHL